MDSRIWRWRGTAAIAGTCGYWLLFTPKWRNPALLLYDAPALMVGCGFAGAALGRMRAGAASLPRLAALMATVEATGVRCCGWGISGHLTVATTVGILEAADGDNPAALRIAASIPVVLLVLIRSFWPQMPLMANGGNTVRALVTGLLLGCGALAADYHFRALTGGRPFRFFQKGVTFRR